MAPAERSPDSATDESRPHLILASASPRRRELLAALSVPFLVSPPDVDETILPAETPAAATVRLARLKAAAVQPGRAERLVLAADTVVVLDQSILNKPSDEAEAWSMLRALRGRPHVVVTGIAVLDQRTGRALTGAPLTRVTMRAYTDEEIQASIARGDPFDKAGAYAVQDERFRPATRVDGCYCNVVGLPLWNVRALIMELRPELAPAPPDARRAVCATCPAQPHAPCVTG